MGASGGGGSLTSGGTGGAQPSGGVSSGGGQSSGGANGNAGGTGGLAQATGGSTSAGGMGGELGLGGMGGATLPLDPCSEGDFGPFELITGLAVDRDKWSPSVTADGLLLVFSASDATSESIYQATRPSREEPFGEALRLVNLEHTSHQGAPFINHDGLRIYYAIEGNQGPDGRDLWFATREQRQDQFGTRRPLDSLNTSVRDHLPWLSYDEKTIYFTTSRNTDGQRSEIWTAQRASAEDFVFSSLSVVNTDRADSEDGSPSLTPDGLTMYFSSDRGGEFDVWSMRRATVTAPFSGARREVALSEQGEEVSLHLSPDGHEMFLSSTGDARQELFIARRNCPE